MSYYLRQLFIRQRAVNLVATIDHTDLFITVPNHLLFTAPINDMRTALSLINSRRQTEPQNSCHSPRNRNIHLRHLKYAPLTRH